MKMSKFLPHFAVGKVVQGFRRGSEMGIPTANFPLDVVKELPPEIETGIYCGWASIDNGEIYKMVMSIGWNPFFDNKEKSMETHILHNINRDFYGCTLKVCIAAYLRPESNFTTVENLIKAINEDIETAKVLLDKPEMLNLKNSIFFKECNNNVNGKIIY